METRSRLTAEIDLQGGDNRQAAGEQRGSPAELATSMANFQSVSARTALDADKKARGGSPHPDGHQADLRQRAETRRLVRSWLSRSTPPRSRPDVAPMAPTAAVRMITC
jgi:hypothetical protein